MARLDTILKLIQIGAILGAGGWAIYVFGFKEASKSQHITPSVGVRVVDPSGRRPEDGGRRPEDGKFTAFELDLAVENVSERDAYIIAALVISFGHRARDVPIDILSRPPIDLREVDAQLMMSALLWSGGAERDVVGELVTLPSFKLIRAEKMTHQYIMFVPSGKYDILEIWAEFHVVNDCQYINQYIQMLYTCYEFAARTEWKPKQPTQQRPSGALAVTPDRPDRPGKPDRWTEFYYREKGKGPDGWEKRSRRTACAIPTAIGSFRRRA